MSRSDKNKKFSIIKNFNNIIVCAFLLLFCFAVFSYGKEPGFNEEGAYQEPTGGKLETPKIIIPNSKAQIKFSTNTPIFKWNKINYANGYTVYVDEITKSKTKRIFESSNYGPIFKNEYRFPKEILTFGSYYSIKMRAFNSQGWSSFSENLYFSIEDIKKKKDKMAILPSPTKITKNNLLVDTLQNGESSYSLVWSKIENVEKGQIVIDGIKTSTIFGQEYKNIVTSNVVDTVYKLNPELFSEFNSYRWKIRYLGQNGWSRFSPYYYFNLKNESILDGKENNEEIVMRLKYSGFVDEMIVAKYTNSEVFLPMIEIISLLQLNHKLDFENNILLGKRPDKPYLDYKLDIGSKEFILGNESFKLLPTNFIEGDLDYFVNKNILAKATGMNVEVDMRNLSVELNADFMIPMVQRIMNEKKLELFKSSIADNSYPLIFNRKRKYLSGGFLDYAATANYVHENSPYYSLQLGMGAELLGGDIQVNTQQRIFNEKLTQSQLRYKWRYAFLNNNYISNISVGHNNALGLQSYDYRGVQISNEPIEARREYGSYKVIETTKPNWKVEIYRNNQLIDIVEADEKGNYDFFIPFNYGTTLLELHEIGPNGEYNVNTKMYQIPIEQVPNGRLDYSANFGRITNTGEYLFQSKAAYGINNWLTTKIGTDIFADDLHYSSFYSNTTARFFDSYIANLTLAPNAFSELSISSLFSNLASLYFGVKIHDQNKKINPVNIKNEIEGNVFLPFKINENTMSVFFRGSHTEYSNSKRTNFSLRTFYNFKNFSPSIEFDYYNLNNGLSNIESTFLNLRLNYSMYIPSAIFSGNIIDARFVYDFMNNKSQSINFSISTTVYQKFRLQISHTTNFNNSYSDTQLRIVFDLPFFRSNSTFSRSVVSQSFIGSVNYNEHLEDFNFYNRGMIGRSAATFKFFVDKNMNDSYDKGENLVPDVDVQINSIGNKRRVDRGDIIINDLESYSKYDVKLIERNNKNPLWFPYKKKFSFVSDPHQYKEIEIPFYEAAEVSGSVMKRSRKNLVPVSGLTVLLKHLDTEEITRVKTMSDGSFYYYGIMPGEYKVFIDKNQLVRLNLNSTPVVEKRLIKSISIEDDTPELNFVLE